MKPYTLADKTKPRTLLPEAARLRLIEEAASIRRCYKTPMLRHQAIDVAVAKIKKDYPEAFHAEQD